MRRKDLEPGLHVARVFTYGPPTELWVVRPEAPAREPQMVVVAHSADGTGREHVPLNSIRPYDEAMAIYRRNQERVAAARERARLTQEADANVVTGYEVRLGAVLGRAVALFPVPLSPGRLSIASRDLADLLHRSEGQDRPTVTAPPPSDRYHVT